MDKAAIWKLTHQERAAMVDTLAELKPSQWAEPSLCAPWSVHLTAAHILAGAEQTPMHFMSGMVSNGFRFNVLMDREARRLGALQPGEIIERLRARTSTTNGPPAPPMTMLGEIVVHSGDIRSALGQAGEPGREALTACLDHFTKVGFPVGAKGRIEGLRLVATDVGWSHGAGPEVTGPGVPLLLAMTGRPAVLEALSGAGVATLAGRMPAAG
jgi:uncharacterized protein (TIGR03083 family)